MKIKIKKIICVSAIILLFISTNATALKMNNESMTIKIEDLDLDLKTIAINSISDNNEDLDPLIDLELTVLIKEIRAFDKIDLFSDPDFYVKIIVNNQNFKSDVWYNQKFVKEQWQKTIDVPDDQEYVNITIQLWDWNLGKDVICDIAKNDNQNLNRYDLNILYNLKTGHWFGDDNSEGSSSWSPDYSGYGRGNGCDDNSIYEKDRDCEIWFDIFQNDYDGDGIPYWTEVNKYDTDPKVDDRGRDDDGDLVPIEWEHKWGQYLRYDHNTHTVKPDWFYDPFTFENHEYLDPDLDSISNVEEYLTSDWNSDPFRKDIFVELDEMDGGPNGEQKSDLPEESKELMYIAFNRQNIVLHIDDGDMGGGEVIPFDNVGEKTDMSEINEIYYDYFLHGDENNWRRGVFHYGLVLYSSVSASGFAFRSNAFQVSTVGLELKATKIGTRDRKVVYASAYMHELGHTLGLTWLGGHYENGKYPWNIAWWIWRPYKSIMNYGYMYGYIHKLVDFSDGSRGKNDFDDWSNIDYSYFET